MEEPLYYSSRRMCRSVIWVKAAEICFLHRPHRAVTPEPRYTHTYIYILLYTPKFFPKPHFFHSDCLFLWPGPNGACCEKATDASVALCTVPPVDSDRHPSLTCLTERPAIAVRDRAAAAAVMSQAIQGHPRLPSPLWLPSIFLHQLSLSLSLRLFATPSLSVIPGSMIWLKSLFLLPWNLAFTTPFWFRFFKTLRPPGGWIDVFHREDLGGRHPHVPHGTYSWWR